MRSIALIAALTTLSALAAEPEYPHWDGQETIAEYAKRAGLEPRKTIDLGNGAKVKKVVLEAVSSNVPIAE